MNAPEARRGISPTDGEHFIEQRLYEVSRKIYPRAVTGSFAGWRWGMVWLTQIIYYGTPWLMWNQRPAVLFDLSARKFYVFGLVLWPQDFIYLALLLVISALALFLFTAIAGRLFCGYACPQTVYTEIFLWVERVIEGDRLNRMRLDQSGSFREKSVRKGLKHAVWIAFSFWTGFTFVGYFTPIRDLGLEVVSMTLGPWETFWVLFYGFSTYGNAGWMREQVCKYMCPYARFQSSMFDRDTMVITYDSLRGEPRGGRARSGNTVTTGLGDCVDCGICVQACPTGIDIRDGLQYECIGCAACIDGCNRVMDRMGYPRGLIRYSTGNALSGRGTLGQRIARVFRPRVLIYSTVLACAVAGVGIALYLRVPLKVDVIRDRASLSREVEGGLIENVYRLQIMNTEETAHRFNVRAVGLPDLRVAGTEVIEVAAASTRMVPIRLRADSHNAPHGTHRIEFIVQAIDDDQLVVRERAVFLVR